MKKALLPFIPMLLLITSCDGLKVDYHNGMSHEPGFDNQTIQSSEPVVNYSYQQNGSFDETGLEKVTIKFKGISVSDSDVINLETIKGYLDIDKQGYEIDIVSEPRHFGTKNEGFAFLGNQFVDEVGEMTLVAPNNIKNVVVKAKQYSYLDSSFNNNKLVIDEDVAISVNESAFVKLSDPVLNDDQDEITNDTECKFTLATPNDHITIRAGKKRAVLEEISLYY